MSSLLIKRISIVGGENSDEAKRNSIHTLDIVWWNVHLNCFTWTCSTELFLAKNERDDTYMMTPPDNFSFRCFLNNISGHRRENISHHLLCMKNLSELYFLYYIRTQHRKLPRQARLEHSLLTYTSKKLTTYEQKELHFVKSFSPQPLIRLR
jgi:hypothetical protein